MKKKIFTPGPTQVHPDVLKASISSNPYHRSSEFKEFYFLLTEKLKKIFLTSHNLNVLTTSGTGSLEASVVNFCRPEEKILFINQGRFGARWGAIAREYGLNVQEIKIPYGSAASVIDLKNHGLGKIDTVFLTHTETSTATLTDIKLLTDYIKNNSDALVAVDAVTSVGAIEFHMDKWNIDVAVSASQKGFMTQPGLAVIAYSEKAKMKMLENSSKRYFLDLRKETDSFKDHLTTWTPAVGLFYGLNKACDLILEEGLEKRWANTAVMADYFRKESLKNGFGIFSNSPSDSLTAITLPGGIPTGKLIQRMKDNYGIQIANGQAEMKDKIARFSHMGDLQLDDYIELNKLLVKEFSSII